MLKSYLQGRKPKIFIANFNVCCISAESGYGPKYFAPSDFLTLTTSIEGYFPFLILIWGYRLSSFQIMLYFGWKRFIKDSSRIDASFSLLVKTYSMFLTVFARNVFLKSFILSRKYELTRALKDVALPI